MADGEKPGGATGSEFDPLAPETFDSPFELYADLAARLGHITTAVVWPAINAGEWVTGITVGRDLNLFVPFESAEERIAA